jgi:hypothetical protein
LQHQYEVSERRRGCGKTAAKNARGMDVAKRRRSVARARVQKTECVKTAVLSLPATTPQARPYAEIAGGESGRSRARGLGVDSWGWVAVRGGGGGGGGGGGEPMWVSRWVVGSWVVGARVVGSWAPGRVVGGWVVEWSGHGVVVGVPSEHRAESSTKSWQGSAAFCPAYEGPSIRGPDRGCSDERGTALP